MNRNYKFLISLIMLQIATTILTAYAIMYDKAIELNPFTSLFIHYFPFPVNYLSGFFVAVMAYILGYYLVSIVGRKYNFNAVLYYFIILLIAKTIDFLNDFIFVIYYHFH